MFKKGFLALFLVLLSVAALVSPALAVDVPGFPVCPSSSGTLISSYDSGIHGIVGDMSEHSGSDQVFQINADQLQQCFCSIQGQGIQTNWWKVSELTEQQLQTLQNLGWYFVPNGALWGLQDSPYVAQNSSFSCGGSGGGGGGGGNAPVCDSAVPGSTHLNSVSWSGAGQVNLSWTTTDRADHYSISYGLSSGKYQFGVPDTGNVTSYTVGGLDPNQNYCFVVTPVNFCQPGPVSNEICTQGGQVLGISTVGNVLGLAYTGTSLLTFGLLIAGIALVISGTLLYRRASR